MTAPVNRSESFQRSETPAPIRSEKAATPPHSAAVKALMSLKSYSSALSESEPASPAAQVRAGPRNLRCAQRSQYAPSETQKTTIVQRTSSFGGRQNTTVMNATQKIAIAFRSGAKRPGLHGAFAGVAN